MPQRFSQKWVSEKVPTMDSTEFHPAVTTLARPPLASHELSARRVRRRLVARASRRGESYEKTWVPRGQAQVGTPPR